MKIKCNGCGFVGEESEFKKSRDFFQNTFISGCPKCDNRQSPGDASMRMFSRNKIPFEYIREEEKSGTPLGETLHKAAEAS